VREEPREHRSTHEPGRADEERGTKSHASLLHRVGHRTNRDERIVSFVSKTPVTRDIRAQRLVQCTGCSLPVIACVCDALPKIATRTRVVVVMHRREAFRTSNTGRLAVKVLTRSSCAIRGGDAPRPSAADFPGKRLVLFPSEGARVLSPADAADDLTLIVPDGTWSQAQRVLRREPCARGAEIVRLPPCAPTRYALRRNTRDGALCTFEAVAEALGVLEGEGVKTRVLSCFDLFLARALAIRGRRDIVRPDQSSTSP
jgi:DTW domain-containing protein YfiP